MAITSLTNHEINLSTPKVQPRARSHNHQIFTMRSSRPAVSLLSSARSSTLPQSSTTCSFTHTHLRPQRPFHTTPPRPAHHKPKHKSLSHADLQKLVSKHSDAYVPYTAEEKASLANRYNSDQIAAIEAAEAAIPASDLATQAKLRRDPLRFTYLDDFSRIEPVIDKKINKLRGEGSDYENVTDFAAMPTAEGVLGEIDEAVEASELLGTWETDAAVSLSEDAEAAEFEGEEGGQERHLDDEATFHQDAELAVKRALLSDTEYAAALADPANEDKKAIYDTFYNRRLNELTSQPPPAHNRFTAGLDPSLDAQLDTLLALDSPDVAPDIPKINDPTVRWGPPEDEIPDLGLEEEAVAAYSRVAKQMNTTVEALRKFRVKTLVNHRVVNQTRLGKIQSVYFLCVAGNERGLVGIGEGKAAEADEAKRVATLNAIRNMTPILRYEDRTVYGEVVGKSGAVEVRLSARQPGYGLRTSEKIFEIARCAGLADLQAKVVRKSRNPMNVAKAVWHALRSQRDPEEVARGRGKKLVDVRKVYYSGLV